MASSALGYADDIGLVGGSGYAEMIDAVRESVPDVTWPASVTTYSRMRTDPQIDAALKAYSMPIHRAEWSIDPAGCRPGVSARIADELGLPVLGAPDVPGPARRRRVVWGEHLRMALLYLVFGHMAFERTYDKETGGLAAIDVRMPSTISRIYVTASGDLDKIEQHGLLKQSAAPVIPRKSLVWYAQAREGAAWTGRSLLRPLYAPWLIKHELWRVHGASIRRFGMGVPYIEAPPGATPQQVAESARLAAAVRGGEQSGIGLPPGYRLELAGIKGSVPDALAYIQYLDQQMTRALLAGVIDLGQTPNGSRALGETLFDLFLLALQSIADDIAAQATAQIVVPLVDVLWGETEAAPKIVCEQVGSDRAVDAQVLQTLTASGLLTPDQAVQEWVRRAYALPTMAPTDGSPTAGVLSPDSLAYMIQKIYLGVGTVITADEARAILNDAGAGLTGPGPNPQPKVQTPPAAQAARPVAAATPLRRELTLVEAASGADFVGMQVQWDEALNTLEAQWDSITSAQRDALVASVEAAVEASDIAALADIKLDSGDAAKELHGAMLAAAETAQADAEAEIKAQGKPTGDAVLDKDRILGMSTTYASLLATGLASLGSRAAIGAWAPEADKRAVGTAVKDAVDTLTGSRLRETLGAALHSAVNAARTAVFSAAPESDQATYYASEVLDGNTCPACAKIDKTAFADLAEAEAAYASGGYSGCAGRLRCRGIYVAVWDG